MLDLVLSPTLQKKSCHFKTQVTCLFNLLRYRSESHIKKLHKYHTKSKYKWLSLFKKETLYFELIKSGVVVLPHSQPMFGIKRPHSVKRTLRLAGIKHDADTLHLETNPNYLYTPDALPEDLTYDSTDDEAEVDDVLVGYSEDFRDSRQTEEYEDSLTVEDLSLVTIAEWVDIGRINLLNIQQCTLLYV